MLIQQKRKDLSCLLRDEHGKILSTFTRLFGIEHLELAEKTVKECYRKATAHCQSKGLPKNPNDWLWSLARIRGTEILRRENKLYDKGLKMNQIGQEEFETLIKLDDKLILDNQIRMLFLCCHPSIAVESQATLTLKFLSGLSNEDIATFFSEKELTVADRFEKGRKTIGRQKLPYELPSESEFPLRLGSVLSSLNRIFKHGYDYFNGKGQNKIDLCHESIKLAALLTNHKLTDRPETRANLSFMLLEASRLAGRFDDKGNVLALDVQDRSLWDRKTISRALNHLAISARGENVSIYHLRAGVSACHTIADCYEKTDWVKILSLYDNYLKLHDDPEVHIERIMAFSRVFGASEGINEIEKLRSAYRLESHHLLHSTLGNLYFQLNNYKEALNNYNIALQNAASKHDQSIYRKRVQICENRIRMAKRYRHYKSF